MSSESTQKKHWAVLGIPPTSDRRALRRAYLSASLATHPDKPGGSSEAFQQVSLAYENLSDVEASARSTPMVKQTSIRAFKCGGYVYAVASISDGGVIAVGDDQGVNFLEKVTENGCSSDNRAESVSSYTHKRIALRPVRGDDSVSILTCCLLRNGQSVLVGTSDGSVLSVPIRGMILDSVHSEIWRHPERRPIIALDATSSFIVCAASDCAYFHVLSLSFDLPGEVCTTRRIQSQGQIDAIALVDHLLLTSGSSMQVEVDSGFVSFWKLDAPQSEALVGSKCELELQDAYDTHLWTVMENEPVFSVAATRNPATSGPARFVAWVSGPTCKTFEIAAEEYRIESPVWTQSSEGRELRAVAISELSGPLNTFVAAGGADETVYVWHLLSGNIASVLRLNNDIHCCLATSCINCITFTSDNKIVSGGYDKKLTVWALSDNIRERMELQNSLVSTPALCVSQREVTVNTKITVEIDSAVTGARKSRPHGWDSLSGQLTPPSHGSASGAASCKLGVL